MVDNTNEAPYSEALKVTQSAIRNGITEKMYTKVYWQKWMQQKQL